MTRVTMGKIEEQRNVVARIDEQERSLPETGVPALPEQLSPALDTQQPLPGQWLGTSTSALSAIERLKATIDRETEKLEIREPVDFEAFSQRKNRGLLELT